MTEKQTILLTGGAGFIGHQMIHKILTETEFDIVTLDRLDTSGNLNRIQEVLQENPAEWSKRVRFIWHDLKAPINDVLSKQIGEVTHVLHLAAGSHVDRSIETPLEFVYDNVVGTANLLEFARTKIKNLKFFLYFSTDEVFGPAPEGVYYKEWDRYNSGNPYSATKAGGEELCLAYQNTYKMPIAITHTMNVFGIRQHPEKYIPLLINNIHLGEKVYIHSNPSKTKAGSRFYINTEDVADAVLFLMDNFVPGEKYNIVGSREVDNLELANIVAKIIGKELNYEMVDFHSSRPGHDLRYALDGTKMKELGWVPRQSIEERLKFVVEWTLSNKHWLLK